MVENDILFQIRKPAHPKLPASVNHFVRSCKGSGAKVF
jgi:hypothetical protein